MAFCLFVVVDLSAAVQSGRERQLVHSRGQQKPDKSVRLHSTAAGSPAAASTTARTQLLFNYKRFIVKCPHWTMTVSSAHW